MLRLSDPARDDELKQRTATEAMARFIGLTCQQILNRDKGDGCSLPRDKWAKAIRSRGQEKLAAECSPVGSSA